MSYGKMSCKWRNIMVKKSKYLGDTQKKKEKYGTKSQWNIETLHKRRKQLNEEEEVLDRVCIMIFLKEKL